MIVTCLMEIDKAVWVRQLSVIQEEVTNTYSEAVTLYSDETQTSLT